MRYRIVVPKIKPRHAAIAIVTCGKSGDTKYLLPEGCSEFEFEVPDGTVYHYDQSRDKKAKDTFTVKILIPDGKPFFPVPGKVSHEHSSGSQSSIP